MSHFWDIQFNYLLTLKMWHQLTNSKPSREAATYLSVLNLIIEIFRTFNFVKAFKTIQAFEYFHSMLNMKKKQCCESRIPGIVARVSLRNITYVSPNT